MVGDCFGGVVLLGKGTALITQFGFNNRDNFFRVTRNRGGADARIGLGDVVHLTVWRSAGGDQVVDAFKGGLSGVNLDNDIVAHHQNFGNDAAGGGRNQAAVFGDGGYFNDRQIKFAAWCVFGVETIAEILSEQGEVLVAHADAPFVDAGGDVLAGLVRPAAVDHVVDSPTVLSLGSDGSANEKVESELTLKIVFFNMFSQGDRYDLGITGRGKA